MRDFLIGIGVGSVMSWVSILIGAFITFRSYNAKEGERFLGGVPKGKVFTIPEVDNAEEFPMNEETLINKTKDFLKVFGGNNESTMS